MKDNEHMIKKLRRTPLKDYPKKIRNKINLKLKEKGIISNRQHRSFRDFSGFLANSLISPMVYAPFREQDKRCFATMENITRHLTSLSLNRENKSLVSVIMPVYNRIDTVKYAIDSVLHQSYTNLELIIIDDGSDDGTKELLDKIKDERVRILYNQTCKGVSYARNQGLRTANGKYIAYLDSDNIWDSRYLAAMIGAFIQLPNAEVVYSGQLLFKGNGKKPFAVRFGSFNKSLLTNRNYIDINALCHTHELYKRIGCFDETLIRLVDYDLIIRMAETSQMYSIPVLLSHYYYDKAQNTITNSSGYVEYLEIVREKRNERLKDYAASSIDDLKFLNDHDNRKISIIIPSYEALDDLRECIDSILTINVNNQLEIIVVDNSSSRPVIDYLDQMASSGQIKLLKNDINYGFTYAVNQGIDLAGNDNDILIMNNDAILTLNAVSAMHNAAYELPDCGIIVPQQVLPGCTKTINEHVPFAYPQYECDVNLSAAHANIINVPVFHSGRVVELSFAPFFCVYIKREVLDKSVGLDPEYGRHYRSDRIFCNYIRHMMNLKIYYVEKAVVFHKLQKSTDDLRGKQDRDANFDIMFHKNQWDPQLSAKLGYDTPVWDF